MSNPIYRVVSKSNNKVFQYRDVERLAYDIHNKNFDDLIIIKSYLRSNKDVIVDMFGHSNDITHIIDVLKKA